MLIVELIQRIRQAGVHSAKLFDSEPRLNNQNYAMQQSPDELARLIGLLAAYEPYEWSLEIGIAAGGTTRFLREQVSIANTVVIDDGRHKDAGLWREHRRHISNLTEFQGDSGSQASNEFLQGLKTRFDLVGIDADHRESAIRRDWKLVKTYLRGGAIVWLHDIHEHGGASVLWSKLKRRYPVLLETSGLGIGVIRYGGL